MDEPMSEIMNDAVETIEGAQAETQPQMADQMSQILSEDIVQDVLRASFYEEPAKPVRKSRKKAAPKSDDLPYKVICISMYKEDLAELDGKVKALKAAGNRKMSRSALIRYALETVDLDALGRDRRHI